MAGTRADLRGRREGGEGGERERENGGLIILISKYKLARLKKKKKIGHRHYVIVNTGQKNCKVKVLLRAKKKLNFLQAKILVTSMVYYNSRCTNLYPSKKASAVLKAGVGMPRVTA